MSKIISKLILFILVLYSIVGFFVLPYVLKPQIIEGVEKETNSKITIESIYFNPFAFKLKISGVELRSLENKHLLSLKSILLNVEVYSLFRSAIHIKNFILDEPNISLVLESDKSLNLSAILKEQENPKVENSEAMEIPRIIVDRIAVVNGFLAYADFTRATKFDFEFEQIGFELKDIDTNDFNSSSARMRFYSTLGDGAFIDLKSEVIGFAPFEVKGSLDFEASKLYTQWRYMQDSLNLEVADGKVAFHTEYYLNAEDLNATILENMSLSLEKLRIKPKSKYKDVLNLDSLYLQEITVKPMLQDVHIAKIGLESLYIKAKRNSSGKIDWEDYTKVIDSGEDINRSKSVEPTKTVKTIEEPWTVVVDELALEKIRVDFHDYAVKPNVKTTLNELNFYMQNVTLAGIEDLKYQMQAKINSTISCNSEGTIKHKNLVVHSNSKCSGFDLIHYKPYIDKAARESLKVYNINLVRGVVGFDAQVDVKESASSLVINVNDANLNLNRFALNKRSNGERLVTFSDFNVNGVKVNTQSKEVVVSKVSLNGLSVRSAMSKKGELNFDNLVVAKKAKGVKKRKKLKISKKAEKDYHIVLKKFALNSARAYYLDKTLSPKVESKLDKINFYASNIDSKEKSWLKYNFSARVNSQGYIKSKGSVRHTPLKQVGNIELKRITLKEINPYLKESAYVKIDDGYLNLKAKTKYAVSKKKPDLSVVGSMNLQEFFISDYRDSSSIFSIYDLGIRSFTYEMSPNRLFIDEVNANSFFVNAVIDKEKVMNFSKLAKASKTDAKAKPVKEPKEKKKEEAFPLTIVKLYVSNGSAFFADYSLPINFKTNIHDLNGVIYAISNTKGEHTRIDITGAVDEYGSTKLKGSLNSSNPKAFLDLDFNFKNLELSNMSGYSASFAGYKIDKGKLYLDLGYKILDSELLGKNSVIIKNIELGDEIEGENSLPLGFVIALLEDKDGVIDIDMPVEGNVDEPDFKYGALIWKTLGNLVVKAVSSPFRFLGSMLGMDGDSLEYAEFESGSLKIPPPEREKLDNVAKMFIKRPKISLSVAGVYDEVSDKYALQKEKLITLVVKESGSENRENHKTAMTVNLLEDIYEDMRDDDKLEKIEEELEETYKDNDEKFDTAYFNAVAEECIKIQSVTKEELEELALQRSYVIKDYLVTEKGIKDTRVKLLGTNKSDKNNQKLVKTKLEVVVK